MAKKYKYTFYENKRKVASCVVSVAQKSAFERLMGSMTCFSKIHNCLVDYKVVEIESE